MNAGRSQMAEGFFERLSKKHSASSAGAIVAEEGKEGFPIPDIVLKVMDQLGYDLSNHRRKQVTPKMIKDSDKVVVLMQKHEVDSYLPDFVKNSPKTEYWNVEDMSDMNLDFFIEKRDEIRKQIEQLVKEIG
jgi:protein-tyrosine-phosphatase